MFANKKYRHRSTRKFATTQVRSRRPRNPGTWRWILPLSCLCVLTIVAALIWGNALKKRSDAYRAAEEQNAWTLDVTAAPLPTLNVPAFRGARLSPGGSITTVSADKANNGVILDLSPDRTGALPYSLPLVDGTYLKVAAGAPSLSDEITHAHAAGLTVSVLFPVTCLQASVTADPATATLRRGAELSLLINVADAGADDILLLDLPWGSDAADTLTLGFLTDVKQSFGYASHRPALGVLLPPDGFATRVEEEDPSAPDNNAYEVVYAGHMTPGRMLTVCDYLALDLRKTTPEEADVLLNKLQYAYVRYALRLVVNHRDVTARADLHGFGRLMRLE